MVAFLTQMCQHILYTKLRHRAVVYTINEDATRYEVFFRVLHSTPLSMLIRSLLGPHRPTIAPESNRDTS